MPNCLWCLRVNSRQAYRWCFHVFNNEIVKIVGKNIKKIEVNTEKIHAIYVFWKASCYGCRSRIKYPVIYEQPQCSCVAYCHFVKLCHPTSVTFFVCFSFRFYSSRVPTWRHCRRLSFAVHDVRVHGIRRPGRTAPGQRSLLRRHAQGQIGRGTYGLVRSTKRHGRCACAAGSGVAVKSRCYLAVRRETTVMVASRWRVHRTVDRTFYWLSLADRQKRRQA